MLARGWHVGARVLRRCHTVSHAVPGLPRPPAGVVCRAAYIYARETTRCFLARCQPVETVTRPTYIQGGRSAIYAPADRIEGAPCGARPVVSSMIAGFLLL